MKTFDLTDTIAVITGANSGIGLETAKVLAGSGAEVIMAVRNLDKAEKAADNVRKEYPAARMQIHQLDLADLASVRLFTEEFSKNYQSLDLLINNAGVMIPPYGKTKDGFELQFGSNHLGHFALTGQLLPLLKAAPGSRVVTVSSLAHKRAEIDFHNLDGANGYQPMKFYGQSKLANLMFALELDRKLKENHLKIISLACHPGISSTNLFKFGKKDAPMLFKKLMDQFLQPAEKGALPTLYAALEPSLKGGEYIGPDGKGRRRGEPVLDKPALSALDEEVSRKLWHRSEELTGVQYAF